MNKAETDFLNSQRSHDVRHLMARWRRVAKAARLVVRKLGEDAGIPVYYLEPRSQKGRTGEPIYLSTGVHGDESGAVLGLLHWAEANVDLLGKRDVFIVPIFNPWGLIENSRTDSTGRDLNRSFHLTDHPVIGPWSELIQDRKFLLVLSLHEDYDAQGTYAYELSRHPGSVANGMLKAAAKFIAPDTRRTIDDRRTTSTGLFLRRRPVNMPDEPEPVTMHGRSNDLAITFETPSEFSLYSRVRAHGAAIDTAVRWASKSA